MKVNTDYLKKVLQTTSTSTGCEAAICGGYLRDLDHGIESKDLDIFILTNYMASLELKKEDLHNGLLAAGIISDDLSTMFQTGQWFGNSESGSNMRTDVIGVKKYRDQDLDFIYMDADSWSDVTQNFDVSVCQIMCKLEEGKLNVYASDSYVGYKKKEKSILRFYPVPTCDSHVERIREKFGKLHGVYHTDDTLNLVGELTEEGIAYND